MSFQILIGLQFSAVSVSHQSQYVESTILPKIILPGLIIMNFDSSTVVKIHAAFLEFIGNLMGFERNESAIVSIKPRYFHIVNGKTAKKILQTSFSFHEN